MTTQFEIYEDEENKPERLMTAWDVAQILDISNVDGSPAGQRRKNDMRTD